MANEVPLKIKPEKIRINDRILLNGPSGKPKWMKVLEIWPGEDTAIGCDGMPLLIYLSNNEEFFV